MHRSAIATVAKRGSHGGQHLTASSSASAAEQFGPLVPVPVLLHVLGLTDATETVLLHLPAPFPDPSAVSIASGLRCATGTPGIDAVSCDDTHVYAHFSCRLAVLCISCSSTWQRATVT